MKQKNPPEVDIKSQRREEVSAITDLLRQSLLRELKAANKKGERLPSSLLNVALSFSKAYGSEVDRMTVASTDEIKAELDKAAASLTKVDEPFEFTEEDEDEEEK